MNLFYAHPRYRLGTHVSLLDTVTETIQYALDHGMTALQVFLGSPQSFQRRAVSAEDATTSAKLLYRFNAHFFSHAPYVYNLANENANVSGIIASLQRELATVSRLGGGGVVLHPGSNADSALGIRNIVEALGHLTFEEKDALLLENMAGQGNVLGNTVEQLAEMWNGVYLSRPVQATHIYFCIDTAHLWGKGEYSIDTEDGVRAFFSTIDSLVLKNGEKFSARVRLIHLNDSEVAFGSRVDRHALIGEGKIWSTSSESLKVWMDEWYQRGVPMVMETDPSDIQKFLCVI